MNDTLAGQMESHQLALLAIADEAIKIRQQPYLGKFGGQQPCSLIHYIDSIRGFVKETVTRVTMVRSNGSEYEHRAVVKLAEYDSWLARVDELFTIINGNSIHSLADYDWRGAYEDDMSPPDAIANFCEDAWGHDEVLPRELAAICAEVLGDWIPVGTAMQQALDHGYVPDLPFQEWLTTVDRMWSYLNGGGVSSAAIVSERMLEQLRWRYTDGKLPVEALALWIFDETVHQHIAYRDAAKFLNALRAGIFDVPGYTEGNYISLEDREYTRYSLAAAARRA